MIPSGAPIGLSGGELKQTLAQGNGSSSGAPAAALLLSPKHSNPRPDGVPPGRPRHSR
jgi:hypothetical protein